MPLLPLAALPRAAPAPAPAAALPLAALPRATPAPALPIGLSRRASSGKRSSYSGDSSRGSRHSLHRKNTLPRDRQLLDEYSVGEVLGEGAFSIVYACEKNSSTGSDRVEGALAVKMVDKVESPIDVIQKEVDLLTKLSHPNILRFIEVFWDKLFVCIVVERHYGGDLFVGMQLHWDTRGKIPCDKVLHVQKQILDAVKFLHSESVVHRDIKGDNYLIDRQDILEQDCRVTLADFGTARRFTPGERLHDQVGTRTYWAPEVFHHDYLEKVDVWANGIVICGLLTGQFPFNGDSAIMDCKLLHSDCI